MYNVTLEKLFRPFKCNTLKRLGKNNDGGYLVNLEDVYATDLLLSFGLGSDISFEKDFTHLNDCSVNAFDNVLSVDKNFFINNKIFYNQLVNKDNLQSILDKSNNIFFKCDIEGSEYDLLPILINNSYKFTGLVIEFHSINEWSNRNNLIEFISKINQRLVHLHVNNYFYYKTESNNIPDILELSFSSSKNCFFDHNLELPNPMDMVNNPGDNEFKIMF